jgi:hypothetical protein
MKFSKVFVIAALMTSSSGISLDKEALAQHQSKGVSEGTQNIIDGAVDDVLKSVGQTSSTSDSASSASSESKASSASEAAASAERIIAVRAGVNAYRGPNYYPTVVPVPVPVAKPYYVPKAVVPAATAPNSSVMRAIADANEAAAADKVKDQRDVANKMEKLEGQAKINQAINESVKKEE